MHQVLVSSTALKALRKLTPKTQERIRQALRMLQEDPKTKRPGADIKQLTHTDPPKHRLRVGEYRIVYRIEKKKVMVIDLFIRTRGYRE